MSDQSKRYAKRIRDRNYRFSKLSPEKKRVRIAKDVIEQLDAKKIVAQHAGYLDLANWFSDDKLSQMQSDFQRAYTLKNQGPTVMRDIRGETEVKMAEEATKAFAEKPLHELFAEEKCTVCGIGACFVAGVKRADKVKVIDLVGTNGSLNDDVFMRKYLGEWFSQEQLAMIEAAFEISNVHARKAGVDRYALAIERSVTFGGKISGPEKRLRAIMQNIIDNKGTFVP